MENEKKLPRVPMLGSMWEHFKGHWVDVLGEATHTETGEQMVVYREYHTRVIYVRPKDMFLSEVDRTKYPDATQQYRFERVL